MIPTNQNCRLNEKITAKLIRNIWHVNGGWCAGGFLSEPDNSALPDWSLEDSAEKSELCSESMTML